MAYTGTEYDTASESAPAVPASDTHVTKPPGSRAGHQRITSSAIDPAPLAEPITFPFSGRTAKNRFLKAPLTERLCHWNAEGAPISDRGVPSEEYFHLYRRWAEGDIGIIVGGNMMVRYDAVEAFGNAILCDDHDGRVAQYKQMTDYCHEHGSLVISQLSHPGRQGGKYLNPNPVSASDVHLQKEWAGNSFAKPRPLEEHEIKEIVGYFAETARLCYDAGYDGVQVHCAHGYLLAQFLSPSTNLRTDEYGGSFENRSRIVLEIVHEIRRRVPDRKFIICAKLNSVEFQDRGMSSDDARRLCIALEEAECDFVDLSGGTFEARAFEHKKDSTKKREAYFIEFAEAIKPVLKKTKVYITGGLRSTEGMVKATSSGACDGVGLGRPITAEPYLCKHILDGSVTGALENYVPLPLNTQSSGSQIHQIGKGHELISDWSVESEVKRWTEANEKETARREAILPKVDASGYAQLEAEAGFAYLAAPAA